MWTPPDALQQPEGERAPPHGAGIQAEDRWAAKPWEDAAAGPHARIAVSKAPAWAHALSPPIPRCSGTRKAKEATGAPGVRV